MVVLVISTGWLQCFSLTFNIADQHRGSEVKARTRTGQEPLAVPQTQSNCCQDAFKGLMHQKKALRSFIKSTALENMIALNVF